VQERPLLRCGQVGVGEGTGLVERRRLVARSDEERSSARSAAESGSRPHLDGLPRVELDRRRQPRASGESTRRARDQGAADQPPPAYNGPGEVDQGRAADPGAEEARPTTVGRHRTAVASIADSVKSTPRTSDAAGARPLAPPPGRRHRGARASRCSEARGHRPRRRSSPPGSMPARRRSHREPAYRHPGACPGELQLPADPRDRLGPHLRSSLPCAHLDRSFSSGPRVNLPRGKPGKSAARTEPKPGKGAQRPCARRRPG
jgi:hypothetical protein